MNTVLVYNLMFLAGIVSSGAGMFVLVRYLTGDIGAALVSAVVFTLAPYRIEHFIHLELQWTVWMPLTLWAMHRTFDEGTTRAGMLTGLFLWLQVISCVYYGAFLGLFVTALALLLMIGRREAAPRAFVPLCVGAMVATALTLPYASRISARRASWTAPGGGGRHVQRRVGQLPGGAAAELAVGLDRVGLHWKRAAPVPRFRRGRARGARSRVDAAAAALTYWR